MPIVFIHGVNVRSTSDFEGITRHLRASVAPLLVTGPGRSAADISVTSCYWGDLGASFAWNLQSLPANTSFGIASMGLSGATLADKMLPLAGSLSSVGLGEILTRQPSANVALDAGIISMGPWQSPTTFFNADPDRVAALLITMMVTQDPTIDLGDGRLQSFPASVANASLYIDAAAHEVIPNVMPDESADVTLARIAKRAKEFEALASSHSAAVLYQGVGPIAQLIDQATAAVQGLIDEANDTTGDALAHTLIGIRLPVSELLSRFLGDIFIYLNSRDASPAAPSSILLRVMDAIRDAYDVANGEPLIILSHSMGGQIMYDLVTWYFQKTAGYDHIKIDFWGAAACQVGIFEEMKLFKSSDPALKAPNHVPAPLSSVLKRWVGYWDPSDVLSFLTSPIISGCVDQVFTSGTTPLQAHGQYLIQPRFYRMLARDVAESLS